MNPKDIKTKIADLLTARFPTIDVVAVEVNEGFNKPSFFVEVEIINIVPHPFFKEVTVRVKIRYYSESEEYLDLLDITDGLVSLFGMSIAVGDNVLTINNPSSGVTQENENKYPEYSFELTYNDGNEVIEIVNSKGEIQTMLPDSTLGYTQENTMLIGNLNLKEQEE